jgi:hypothetical protein
LYFWLFPWTFRGRRIGSTPLSPGHDTRKEVHLMMGRIRLIGLSIACALLLPPGWSRGQDTREPEPPLERIDPLPDAPRPENDDFPVTPPPARVESAPLPKRSDGLPPPADEMPPGEGVRGAPLRESPAIIVEEPEILDAEPVVGAPIITSTRPVWVAGHFERQPNEIVEMPGYWTRPLIGAPRYVPPQTRTIPGRIEWVPGHWRRTRVAARPVMLARPMTVPLDAAVSPVEFDAVIEDDAADPGPPPFPGARYVPGRWKQGLLGKWRYVPARWSIL